MSELLDFILTHEEAFTSKARLTSLYSDFAALRHANPDGYAANSSAWRSALEHAARAGLVENDGGNDGAEGSPLLLRTGPELLRRLEQQDLGRPIALGSVVTDAVAAGSLIPLPDFLHTTTSIYQKSWTRSLPTPSLSTVARWLLTQIGLTSSSASSGRNSGIDLIRSNFVVLPNLEEVSNAILAHASKLASASIPSSTVHSPTTFAAEFAHFLAPVSSTVLTPTSQTLQILLKHLSRDRNALSVHTSANGETTIKFTDLGRSTTTTNTTPSATRVTAQDETIAKLKTLVHSLTLQTTTLSTRINSLDAEARSALSSTTTTSNRSRALHALRTKRATEALLTKRQDSLAQVQNVLASIDEAAGQVEMVDVMERSAKVLSELNRQTGGVERVERVVDGLREEMEGVNAVQGALGEVGREGEGVVDEDEVEGELRALEKETKSEKEAEEAERKEQVVVTSLPDVPSGVVGEQPEKTSSKTAENQEASQETEVDDDELTKSLEDLTLLKAKAKAREKEKEEQNESAQIATEG